MSRISVQPEWCTHLPLQQQTVLMVAGRGPDGIAKSHPCKDVQRAYRGTVFVAAKYGRLLRMGEKADSFMALDLFSVDWANVCERFYDSVDDLPWHFLMHLLHGAEILGYRHPDLAFRERWRWFYLRGCEVMHVDAEAEAVMDVRLCDWNRENW